MVVKVQWENTQDVQSEKSKLFLRKLSVICAQ